MTIDLNADLGEGYGVWTLTDDEALLGIVTSANVACGFHAGDPTQLRRVCRDAAARGVAVGAHVSYPDRQGFGRRYLDIAADELEDAVLYQLSALDGIARAEGAEVRYVKPHGALYHALSTNREQAGAVVRAIAAASPGLAVLGLPGALWLELAAEAGLRPVAEAFADRAYQGDGSLVPRGTPGAVLTDPERIVARALVLATQGVVEALDGTMVSVSARSLCVHGDTPGAVALAAAIRAALEARGLAVVPFA